MFADDVLGIAAFGAFLGGCVAILYFCFGARTLHLSDREASNDSNEGDPFRTSYWGVGRGERRAICARLTVDGRGGVGVEGVSDQGGRGALKKTVSGRIK